MRYRRMSIVLLAIIFSGSVHAQQSTSTAPNPEMVIRKESRLVLVDAVVTDKKGNYLHDLKAKDFRILEDGKEQNIQSLSVESATAGGRQQHYLVLFFDTASMSSANQQQARETALKFLEVDGVSGLAVAVVQFGGDLKVLQNFTSNEQRLKSAILNLSGAIQTAQLLPSERNFKARTTILALRGLARNLGSIPGRKTLVLFTSGFPTDVEQLAEINSAIDTCNRANVGIYPVDVRGLVSWNRPKDQTFPTVSSNRAETSARFRPVSFEKPRLSFAAFSLPQSTGGNTSSGASGSPRGTANSNQAGQTIKGNRNPAPPTQRPTSSVPSTAPPLKLGVAENQQIMRALAEGTGGFVIANTNDLLRGLEKIAREQSEYYVLGYVPAPSAAGSCHELKVKVLRGGAIVRARSGYCNVKPKDLLAGTPSGRELEEQLSNTEKALAVPISLPFFYTDPNTARVNLAIDIPGNAFKMERQNGKHFATVNILGIAYAPDGSIAGRFSDTATTAFDSNRDAEDFKRSAFHYEKQFELTSGTYVVRIALNSGGETIGNVSAPLTIDNYDGTKVVISGIAMASNPQPADKTLNMESALIEDRTPIIYRGLVIEPSASNQFQRNIDHPVIYAELYGRDTSSAQAPNVTIRYRVLDPTTQAVIYDTGKLNYDIGRATVGRTVLLCLKLPVEKLPAGKYVLQLVASADGRESNVRLAHFELK